MVHLELDAPGVPAGAAGEVEPGGPVHPENGPSTEGGSVNGTARGELVGKGPAHQTTAYAKHQGIFAGLRVAEFVTENGRKSLRVSIPAAAWSLLLDEADTDIDNWNRVGISLTT